MRKYLSCLAFLFSGVFAMFVSDSQTAFTNSAAIKNKQLKLVKPSD